MRDMVERMQTIRLWVLAVLTMLGVLVWVPQGAQAVYSEHELTVRFLDVGQGDAIQIETPDGYELLIDGGPSAAVLRELSLDRSFFDRNIDVVIVTHPDSDHIAGLVDVLERYEVGMIIESGVGSETQVAAAFAEAARTEGARRFLAQAGDMIQLGASTTIQIISPYGDTVGWETNTASVVVRVVYGETAFMLTGDAPIAIEDHLVDTYGTQLHSDVLKLGHHGSKTSSSEEFLNVVQPKYAVVSAGADNRYGHPHQVVLDRAGADHINIERTDETGAITFKSDGKKVWVE